MLETLPIDPHIPRLLALLQDAPNLVLEAAPGAGKTTRVPPALLQSDLCKGQILMLEPRRIAARQAATRIAAEQGFQLGEEVGYQVRFEQRSSENTRLLVMTEGLALRRLVADPFLEDVGLVIFDEFHERHTASDIVLAMLYQLQQEVRDDLRIVVMSATLPSEKVSSYLGDAPIFRCPGRSYPVDLRYRATTAQDPLPESAASGVEDLLKETEGDILVFLPGQREIRETQSLLSGLAAKTDLQICPLYGEQAPQEQERALRPATQRKIILSTNVAETSLTIPGVRSVVDTGWARKLLYDPNSGLNRLELERISLASATQRAGRAGREAPGLCLRLWSPHQPLQEEDIPEVQRVELSGTLLQLMTWGERDPLRFPWLTPPPEHNQEQALALLDMLGAIQEGQLTERGKKMAELPIAPRLAAVLLDAKERGVLWEACLLAALLSERHPFSGLLQERPPRRLAEVESDLLDQMNLLEESESPDHPNHPRAKRAIQQLRKVQQQLARILSDKPRPSKLSPIQRDEALAKALLAGYPDRVAQRRDGDPQRALLSNGKGVRLDPKSQVKRAPLYLALDVDASRRQDRADAFARMASAIQEDWLPKEHLRQAQELSFDPQKQRVIAAQKVFFQELCLKQRPATADPDEAAVLLAEEAARDLMPALGLDQPEYEQLLLRLRALHRWLPELESPTFDDAMLQDRLPLWCMGKRSFQELRQQPWQELLLAELSYPQQRALREEIPERIEVPSGSILRIEYREDEAPPILSVRIQEVFGWLETPRIAKGRIPLLLHLLAPNMRPQQVTQDLHNFWQQTYTEVRKELRQRYPKHAWPEDPFTAQAERRPQRKRS
ncbi:MAG: ATP-dependent helicase HrpB [Myxococcales bacterium]|nr:ATP-dependent helicase HrpB [Myxococcales bacterium]